MSLDIEALSEVLDEEIIESSYLTRGQIGDIYTLTTPTRRCVVKTSDPSPKLQTEADMLRDIQQYGIAVPQVIDVSPSHLLMTYIKEERLGVQRKEEMAAKTLAALHSITNDARMYGYWYDTTIGPFEQKNEQTQYHWALFYAQMRVMPMAKICYDKGVLSKALLVRLETLCSKLYTRINMSKITPSLIHGDLWSGNVLFTKNGAVLIDPAIYFGDKEVDLAFIRMFNTFGETFFSCYKQIHPFSDDFESVKVPLYQIYYYLVHIALYGEAYSGGLRGCLEKLKA